MAEFWRLDDIAQRNRLAMRVRHFDTYGRFSWNSFDQDRLGAQRKTEILAEARNAAVLDACLGLELKRRHHRPGIDLRYLPVHFEFLAFELDRGRVFLQ